MLADAVGRDRAWLLAHEDAALSENARERLENTVARRARGEPLAYVFGRAGFYGREFAVTPDVLVPRPESEQLVELALAFVRRQASSPHPLRLADVGTGSGVLAIVLALELPAARLCAVDASAAALAVARRNARAHGVAERIDFVLGDAFPKPDGALRFDCVTANLPYVRSADLAPAPDATSFEPRLALDGGADGLAVYRRLLGRAPEQLAGGGAMFLEAGPDTAEELAALADVAFEGRARVELHRDYAGRQRVVEVALR